MRIRTPKQLLKWYIDRFFLTKPMRVQIAQQELGYLKVVYLVILIFGLVSLLMCYGVLGNAPISELQITYYYFTYIAVGFTGFVFVVLLQKSKTKNYIINCIPYYIPMLWGYTLVCYVILFGNNIFAGIIGFATIGLVTIMCLQIEPVFYIILLSVVYGLIFEIIRQTQGIIAVIDLGVLNILFMGLSLARRKTVKYNLLRTKSLEENRDIMRSAMAEQVEELHSQEEMLAEQHQKIIDIQNNTIISLSNLVENRDSDTGEHVRRTSAYVSLISLKAQVNGLYKDILTDEFIMLAGKAAPMHDIGKIVVPDRILKKPGKLTTEEFEEIKRHTVEGGRIISEIFGKSEDQSYVRIAKEIATSHHERWDGTGYPHGLKGEEIPLSARIMAIADVFDALVSPRCYKEPFPLAKAMEIIREESGTHFDPVLVDLFLSMEDDTLAIMERYKD